MVEILDDIKTYKENKPEIKYNKWNLHGGKTTMLYLNLSGHNIFKKEVWHLTGKTLPNSSK